MNEPSHFISLKVPNSCQLNNSCLLLCSVNALSSFAWTTTQSHILPPLLYDRRTFNNYCQDRRTNSTSKCEKSEQVCMPCMWCLQRAENGAEVYFRRITLITLNFDDFLERLCAHAQTCCLRQSCLRVTKRWGIPASHDLQYSEPNLSVTGLRRPNVDEGHFIEHESSCFLVLHNALHNSSKL